MNIEDQKGISINDKTKANTPLKVWYYSDTDIRIMQRDKHIGKWFGVYMSKDQAINLANAILENFK